MMPGHWKCQIYISLDIGVSKTGLRYFQSLNCGVTSPTRLSSIKLKSSITWQAFALLFLPPLLEILMVSTLMHCWFCTSVDKSLADNSQLYELHLYLVANFVTEFEMALSSLHLSLPSMSALKDAVKVPGINSNSSLCQSGVSKNNSIVSEGIYLLYKNSPGLTLAHLRA